MHANAGGGRGFESFVCSSLKAGHRTIEMQKSLHRQVMKALKGWNIVDRGLKQAAFYVLRHNPFPAILIESLFVDNEREAGLWQEEHFVNALAGGVVRGVQGALGMEVTGNKAGIEGPQAIKREYKSLYTVQVGAFAYVENARQRLQEAREAGFTDAYIYHKQF